MNVKNLIHSFALTFAFYTGVAAPSFASDVEVTHIANAGIKIASGDKSVVIDALFTPSSDTNFLNTDQFEQLASQSTDLVLATTASSEHFGTKRTISAMLQNPDALLISTPKVIRKMRSSISDNRLVAPKLELFESAEYQYQGIKVTVFRVPHSDQSRPWSTQNYAFLVEIDRFKVLHAGNANVQDIAKSFPEPQIRGIDLAVVPALCVNHESCVKHLNSLDIKSIAFATNSEQSTQDIASNAPYLAALNKPFELKQ